MEKEKHTRLENVMHHRIAWLRQWLQMRNYDIGDKRMTYLCICYCTLRAVQEQQTECFLLHYPSMWHWISPIIVVRKCAI